MIELLLALYALVFGLLSYAWFQAGFHFERVEGRPVLAATPGFAWSRRWWLALFLRLGPIGLALAFWAVLVPRR